MRTLSCWLATGTVAIVLFMSTAARAQTQKADDLDSKAVSRAVFDSLHDIINHGADLFNKDGDAAGCYHAYRAGLIAIRPFLTQHPDLQKTIDDGLVRAEEKHRVAARAFVLNEVLSQVRKKVAERSGLFADTGKGKGNKMMKGEQNPEVAGPGKKTDRGEKKGSQGMSAGPAAMARLSGRVSYKGNPVSGGWYVTLVSSANKHTFSTHIGADGAFSFKTPIPPGLYTIAIEEGPRVPGKAAAAQPAIPERYRNPVTSALTVQLEAGKQVHDLQLQ